MKRGKGHYRALIAELGSVGLRGRLNPAGIFAVSEDAKCLDTGELAELERSFRGWVGAATRVDVRASRRRILLIFLLIRYTGARLSEILDLDPQEQMDFQNHCVRLGRGKEREARPLREVQIPAELSRELKEALDDSAPGGDLHAAFGVDPGHLRRKFYERAQACGFPPKLGNPNAIRRSRAVELLRSNIPLPVVQRLLGHSTPSLAAAYVDFSAEDMRLVTRHFVEKESRRKTSARNTFFGKIISIRGGDIQSRVEIVTLGGDSLTTVITNDSLVRLGLKRGSFVAAEVKAPWVVICKGDERPVASAENQFRGSVTRIRQGEITTEFVVRIADGTELCSIVTEESRRDLDIKEDDTVWVMFNSFAVILNVD